MTRLDFGSSPRSSVGVEWEMQVIDPDSLQLAPGVSAIENVLAMSGKPHPDVDHEIIQSTLEIKSGAQMLVRDAVADLDRVRSDVIAAGDKLGYAFIASGIHPFSAPADQVFTDTEHYRALVQRAQFWAHRILTCGLHVHVGIEDVDKVIPIQNALLTYLGQFQALAANSPFWRGENTGYASFRPSIFHNLTTAGLPFQFADWDGFSQCIHELVASKMIEDAHNIFWDLRPAPQFGTLEIRMFDTVPSLHEVGAIAALSQCVVESLSTDLDEGRTLPQHSDWVVRRNAFESVRFGRKAELITEIVDGEPVMRTAEESLVDLIEGLAPVADYLGCREELGWARDMVDAPAPFERQLSKFSSGGFAKVISDLREQWEASV